MRDLSHGRAACAAPTVHESDLRSARAAIAQSFVASERHAILGEIVLRAPQRAALARVTRILDDSGGCLLADDVGRGKTYVALAAARRWTRPLVVVPAGLTEQWRHAMRRAGAVHRLITHESLSRGGAPDSAPDGIVVDESHHFRNMATRRYAHLADIATHSELLLLSATPIQNRASDLAAQLALFVGSTALRLDDPALMRFVVRIEGDAAESLMPAVKSPRWVHTGVDDARVLDAIMALPSPPRALDAGDAGALRTLSLVRAWASSHAALRAAMSRRLGTAHAIAEGLAAARLPTRAELRGWRTGDDALQLGFASLLAAHDITHDRDTRTTLQGELDAELTALATLQQQLARATRVDEARARALIAIVDSHPHARVIAFTQLASTARGYYTLLHRRPGVALLTASGGVIASGRIGRRDILARFAPVAQGTGEPPRRERIGLLISTDLLSEGVNLQDASVVVHLDLPWNPARLAQRLGRVRRPGGAAEVTSLLLAPPASTEHLVRIEQRLHRKLAAAARVVGSSIDVVPVLTLSGVPRPLPPMPRDAECQARLEARVRAWSIEAPRLRRQAPSPVTAAVRASAPGWLALLSDGRLIACREPIATGDAALIDWATDVAEGPATAIEAAHLQRAHRALECSLQRERLLADCGLGVPASELAHVARRRICAALAASSRHVRARCLQLAAEIERALSHPVPLGAERAMARILASESTADPVNWLADLLGCLPHRSRGPAMPPAAAPPLVLIVFQPPSGTPPSTKFGGAG